VLESDAAKLWGVFGWSEIGLGYFAANGLLILFLPSWIPFLAILNLFTLPYSFWSVWYQKFKAKQWCPLCLMVQALLWGIFVVNLLFGFIRIPDWNWSNCLIWVAIASTYGVCMLTLNLLIPKLSENTKIEQLNQEINSIKANEDVFSALLKQQPRYEVNPSDSQIVFGNPEARLQITILTNPFCNPCASMHRRVENFLQETQGRVCIRYIFASFHPRRDFASKGLIAAYLQKERNKFEHIIADWFQEGKLLKEAFFNDLQLDMTDPAIEAELQKHEAWRAKTQLRATPTIIINGYQLPGNYKIEDLRYFIELEIDIDQSQAR
jgi:protein-disulfide isomerase